MSVKEKDLVKKILYSLADIKTSRIPGFYRLSVEQRLAYLARVYNLSKEEVAMLREGSSLKISHAVNMVENAIGVFGLPLGLAANFLIDDKEYLIPMAIEEPSIIAAASKAALLIREGGGFKTSVDPSVMIGQVQICGLSNLDSAEKAILKEKREILNLANKSIPRMRKRGGGAIDLEVRKFSGNDQVGPILMVHLLIDVCEAMGANTINTACEAIGPMIEKITRGRVNMRILSNLSDRRLARAEFSLPVEKLSRDKLSGEEVASHLLESGYIAEVDPYRAATHNKGIFNGLSAAALALGQDWRAIEAGGHAYAARSGQYRSLSHFEVKDRVFRGSIELPVQVGMVGGATKSHPGVRILRKIIGVDTSRQLAGLLAAVGLGQTFAACLALSTEGIQKGHMTLHARSVAISAGVPSDQVGRVAQEMVRRGEIKVDTAEEIYGSIRKRKIHLIRREKHPVEAFAPGKTILFGEHAIVYNYPGIIVTIDQGLKVKIRPDDDGPRFVQPEFAQTFPMPDTNRDFRKFSQAVDIILDKFNLQKEQIEILVESELVPGVGLGSSASFSVALCRAFRNYIYQENGKGWSDELFEAAQELEKVFHGNPSGADVASILHGGVIWFRKANPREIIPLYVSKTMYGVVCVVEEGARTLDMVRKVQCHRERDQKYVDTIFNEIGDISIDARLAFGMGDAEAIGHLMSRNHELLARLGLSTSGLDHAVDYIMDHGALGAKLTGAGGGGAVVALVSEDDHQNIKAVLKDKFQIVNSIKIPATV